MITIGIIGKKKESSKSESYC